MDVITSALQAIGLFLVTNIDDIIVLSLFFARGAGQRGTTTKIVVGQYLGFGGILLASVAVTFGAGLFLPDDAIPYFGLIPLLLGVYAAWQVWRNGDDDDDTVADKPDQRPRPWPQSPSPTAETTSGSTCRCSSRSAPAPSWPIASCSWPWSLVLVLAAKFVATRKPIAEVLERWEHILFPLVLIVLGLVILIEGGAFGL